jgi:sphinganine C4-monooxygenase
MNSACFETLTHDAGVVALIQLQSLVLQVDHSWQKSIVSHAMEVLRQQVSWASETLAQKMRPGTDEFWMVFIPPLVYWVVAIYFDILDHSTHPYVMKHRVTRRDRGRENPVGRWAVIQRVILQHVLQTLVGLAVMLADPDHYSVMAPKSWLQSAMQFVIAMFIMDAWQYWIHRAVHVNTWLYKHIHSVHHQLLITYAYGALYNNPIEAILLDTCGAGVAMFASGMTCRLATAFFAFSTIKTVVDHSNYRFPLNPLHDVFPNSAAYHDVHHDIRGIKKNFSQPFFTFWDVICGTYLDPADFHLTQVTALSPCMHLASCARTSNGLHASKRMHRQA